MQMQGENFDSMHHKNIKKGKSLVKMYFHVLTMRTMSVLSFQSDIEGTYVKLKLVFRI